MSTTFLKDYAERVIRTAIQAFLGVLAAGWATTGFNVTSLHALLVAAFSAAAAAIMALLTKGIGSGDTASILTPDPVDPDPVVPVDPPAWVHRLDGELSASSAECDRRLDALRAELTAHIAHIAAAKAEA